MKIHIKSRIWIEARAKLPFINETAVISICDTALPYAWLVHKPHYFLQLKFNDVDSDIFSETLNKEYSAEERNQVIEKYGMITDAQAQQIAQFCKKLDFERIDFICQCEHGQSRSAAVAAAILQWRTQNAIEIFAHDEYYPNKFVYKKVLSWLQKE